MKTRLLSALLVFLLIASVAVPAVSAAGKGDRFEVLMAGIELSAVETLSDGKVSTGNMTVGVPVKFSDGSYGLITCGHEIKEGMSVYQPKYDENNPSQNRKVGTVVRSHIDGVDASLIKLDPGIKCQGSIFGLAWNGNEEPINIDSYGEYDSNKIFKYCGITSGNVKDLSINKTDLPNPRDKPHGELLVKNALKLEGKTAKGDSGAPVFQNYGLVDWNNKLVGIISQGTRDGDGKCIAVWVQQIQPILDRFKDDGFQITILTNGNI